MHGPSPEIKKAFEAFVEEKKELLSPKNRDRLIVYPNQLMLVELPITSEGIKNTTTNDFRRSYYGVEKNASDDRVFAFQEYLEADEELRREPPTFDYKWRYADILRMMGISWSRLRYSKAADLPGLPRKSADDQQEQ